MTIPPRGERFDVRTYNAARAAPACDERAEATPHRLQIA
jgi:hypothetical protein